MLTTPDPFSPQALEELRNHPGLMPAIVKAAHGTVSLFDGQSAGMRKMFQDRGSYMTGLAAMALLGMDSLTLQSLKSACAAMGFSSPGRVNRFWTDLRASGYLTMTRLPDGRLDRSLTASPELIDQYRRHRTAFVEAIGYLWPDVSEQGLALMADDQAYLKVEASICGVQAMHRDVFLFRNTPINMFIERNAGLLILLHLFTEDPPQPKPLSINALAKRFGVSRPHVKKLFEDARQEGLVIIDDEARTLCFTEAAADAFIASCSHLMQAVRIGLEMALAQAQVAAETRQPL